MMWVSRPIYLVLLTFGYLAAAKSRSIDKFEEYHTKSLATAPVKLNDASYEYLTSLPRTYSVAVLLTAIEARFGCQLCRDFQPEWEVIGKSWIKGDRSGQTRVIVGTLDFSDGKGTFQKVIITTEFYRAVASSYRSLFQFTAHATNRADTPRVSSNSRPRRKTEWPTSAI